MWYIFWKRIVSRWNPAELKLTKTREFFTDSLFSWVYPSIELYCLNLESFTIVSLNFGSFSQTKIILQAQSNIISTDADIIKYIWRRKHFLSSEIRSKHQKHQRRSLAAWKILLSSMRVDRFVCYDNIVPLLQTPSILSIPGTGS